MCLTELHDRDRAIQQIGEFADLLNCASCESEDHKFEINKQFRTSERHNNKGYCEVAPKIALTQIEKLQG